MHLRIKAVSFFLQVSVRNTEILEVPVDKMAIIFVRMT